MFVNLSSKSLQATPTNVVAPTRKERPKPSQVNHLLPPCVPSTNAKPQGRTTIAWSVFLACLLLVGFGLGTVSAQTSPGQSPTRQAGGDPVRITHVSTSTSVSPARSQPSGPANDRGPARPPLSSDRRPARSRRKTRRKGSRDKAEIERDRQLQWDRTMQEVEQLVAEHHAAMPRSLAKWIGAVYARYSTRFQDSIVDQVRAILAEATKLGIHVPLELVFFDLAVRGMKKNRRGLGALEVALKGKKAEVLLLFSTSRLFRKQYRTLEFVDRVHKGWGMRCIFTKSGVDTNDKKRWETILATQSMIDQFVVTMYVDNIHAAHEGLLEKRLVFGTLSFGYRGEEIPEEFTARGKPRCRIAIDDETAPIVQRIFHWYAEESVSINEIIRRLNDDPAIPLPPRCSSGEWTRLSVKGILENTRYRGLWRYGTTESIYQPDGDYVRQKPRVEPLKEVNIEEFRLVPDSLWYAAQERLLSDKGSRGRKAKKGDRQSRPRMLNGLFYCPEHDRPLYVGGAYGNLLFCASCQRTSAKKRPLYTQLNRSLALEITCRRVAELIGSDEGLIEQVMEACRRQVEIGQRPDPTQAAQLQAQVEKLNRSIEFALRNPGDTEEDQQYTKRLLHDQRSELATLRAELARLLASQQCPIRVPTAEEVKQLIGELHSVLTSAAVEGSEEETAIARAIIDKITGGRITLHQQGERKAQRGWLQGRFRLQLLDLFAQRLTGGSQPPLDDAVEITIDYQKPIPTDEESELAWSLHKEGKMNAEIAIILGCCRAKITKLLKNAAEKHGEDLEDGRTRRSGLTKKHLKTPLYQEIADRVIELWNGSDLQIDEIASQLQVDRNTITHAVAFWHKSRGLPVPDGRARRKLLKSRASQPREDNS